MKKIAILLASIFYCSFLFSQDIEKNSWKFKHPNSFQIEVGGHGLLYSLNYERIVFNGERFKTSGQFGISYYPASTGIRDFWMPLIINEIFSFENHHIEIGAGIIFIREASRDFDNIPTDWYWSEVFTGRVGYRFQKPKSRFLLRVGFTPFAEVFYNTYADMHSVEFHPSGGLSIGYAF